ncbi:hypothetical protein M3Y99_01814000 [Aphelenchoides fujianensis]|nr:hypothetical protein M3Y99_01814000 [Aphelenchoides fujianensis]
MASFRLFFVTLVVLVAAVHSLNCFTGITGIVVQKECNATSLFCDTLQFTTGNTLFFACDNGLCEKEGFFNSSDGDGCNDPAKFGASSLHKQD